MMQPRPWIRETNCMIKIANQICFVLLLRRRRKSSHIADCCCVIKSWLETMRVEVPYSASSCEPSIANHSSVATENLDLTPIRVSSWASIRCLEHNWLANANWAVRRNLVACNKCNSIASSWLQNHASSLFHASGFCGLRHHGHDHHLGRSFEGLFVPSPNSHQSKWREFLAIKSQEFDLVTKIGNQR